MKIRQITRAAVALLACLGLVACAPPTTLYPRTYRPAVKQEPTFDHVLFWDSVLLDALRRAGGPPTTLTRAAAIMHVAIYDAANSITPIGTPYLAKYPGSGDLDSVIDRAAYDSLRGVFPDQDFLTPYLSAQPANPLTLLADGGPGASSAAAILTNRFDDGGSAPMTYAAVQSPGHWRPTGSGEAASPEWGSVKPWTMIAADQFRPPDPLGFTDAAAMLRSRAYADQVNEVASLGRWNSITRTPDQTNIARFWAEDLDGTEKPPGQLLVFTQIVARNHGLSEVQNARLFALVSMGLADAAITAWNRKYYSPLAVWRPETAIQQADLDDNPLTVADRGWHPLSSDYNDVPFTPPFPSYTSGHSTMGGAWSTVMSGFFGTDRDNFTGTTDDPHCVGCTRNYTSYSQAGFEDAISRVYNGVHFKMDCEQGYASGRRVGEWTVSRYLLPAR